MAAIIESVATSVSDNPLWHKGALRLADYALTESLQRADRKASDIGLLINAGVYREKNLGEPALASMIQEDVGANPERDPDASPHGTFSFDVSNGGCGVLTAVELVDGFLASKTIELGAVVASDSDPGGTPYFPFPSVGGALLLRPGTADTGFMKFSFETFPHLADRLQSHIVWHPREHHVPFTAEGRNVLEIVESEDFAVRALDCAEELLQHFFDTNGLRPEDVDLLIASAYPPTFAMDLGRAIGLPENRIAIPDDDLRGAHTAGVIAALESSIRSGRFAAARNVLFVAVGAGMTVAAALYRQ